MWSGNLFGKHVLGRAQQRTRVCAGPGRKDDVINVAWLHRLEIRLPRRIEGLRGLVRTLAGRQLFAVGLDHAGIGANEFLQKILAASFGRNGRFDLGLAGHAGVLQPGRDPVIRPLQDTSPAVFVVELLQRLCQRGRFHVRVGIDLHGAAGARIDEWLAAERGIQRVVQFIAGRDRRRARRRPR